MPATPSPVVTCAEDIRALYPHPIKATLKSIAISCPFLALAALTNTEWLGAIGIVAVSATIVIPHVIRVERFLRSIPCAACHLPAGKHTTIHAILHLKCQHCHHVSQTDCMFLLGTPSKI
jgi:hypothetical protein